MSDRPESKDVPAVGYAKPVTITGFAALRLSARRSVMEIVFVLGGFVWWLAMCILTPVGQRLDQALSEFGLYGTVLSNGLLILALVALVTWAGPSTTASMGFVNRDLWKNFGVGLAAVIPSYLLTVAVSVTFLMITVAAGWDSFESFYKAKQPMFEAVASVSPWMVLPVALFIGVYEEVLFRGFLLGRLISLTGRGWAAVLISTVVFGLMHYPGQGWLGVLQTSCLGAALAILVIWRKSLWPAIICHAGIDTVGIFLTLILKPFLEQFAPGQAPGV